MEKFHLILHLLTSFLVFAPCPAHGEKAVGSIHMPHSEKEGTSSKLKILKVKRRETDYCEGVIQNYRARKQINAACQSPQCSTKPSRPAELNYVIRLNNTTKMLDLHITWKKPKTGSSSLCGFQINIASLKKYLYTTCLQFNSKNLFSYSIPGLSFDGRYNITIVNLPPYENADESSNFVIVESPDKCTVFKQLNESLPWYCGIKSNFLVACKNGFFNFTLGKLHKVNVDGYFSTLMRRGSPKLPFHESFHTKEHPFVAYSNLTLDVEYVLMVIIAKNGTHHTVKSQPFTCKAATKTTTSTTTSTRTSTISSTTTSTTKPKPYNPVTTSTNFLLKILLPTIFCILLGLFLIICIRGRVISKLRERFRSRYRRPPPDRAEGIHLKENEQVDL